MSFDINITDETLCEADSEYDNVLAIMEEEAPGDWMLRSDMTIDSPSGLAHYVLHFYKDRTVRIIHYQPSVGDVYYNPDMQCIAQWTQEKGWNIPEPDTNLVRENIEFWKHYWETGLVNSDYLEERYGDRGYDPDFNDFDDE